MHTTLHHRFAEMADREPGRLALCAGAERLTYGDLRDLAGRFAAALHPAAARQRRVAADLGTVAGIVAMLGTLAAGAAFAPLPPTPRRRAMLDRVRPDWRLDADARPGDAPSRAGSDATSPEAWLPAADDLAGGAPPHDAREVAQILWSRGVDGRDGATLLAHHELSRFFDATAATFEFGPDDVWLLGRSDDVLALVWQVLGALLHGATLVLPDPADDGATHWTALMAEHRVTVWTASAAAFGLLCRHLEQATPSRRAAVAPAFVLLWGARPPATLTRRWTEAMGDATALVHLATAAEAAGPYATLPLPGGSDPDATTDAAEPIGDPVPDLRFVLLDEHGSPTPAGALGELCLAGAGWACGYDGEPARTAAVFVPDGSDGTSGARLLRTGDLARVAAGGRLVRQGRADRRLRVRGLPVLLDDVEAGLRRCRGVADTAVLPRPGTDLCELDAWIVPDGAPLGLARLQAELRTLVPQHALPHRYVEVPALVRADGGGLDLLELRATGRILVDDRPPDRPASDDERSMRDVWAEVLAAPDLRVCDDFFAAGGDSILAVKLVLALGAAGWQVTVQALLQAATVRGLVDHLPGRRPAVPPPSAPSPAERSRAASDLQCLLIDRYARHAVERNGVYHVQQAYTLEDTSGAVDLERLRHGYEAEFAAGASFRTWFEPTDQGHRRAHAARPLVEIRQADVRCLDATEQAELLQRHAHDDLQRPFEPTNPEQPLTRLALYRLSASQARVVKSTHHAIDDGWGQTQLVSRVLQAYAGGRPDAEAAAGDPFDAYVAQQRRTASDPAATAFWDGYPIAFDCLVAADRAPPSRFETVSTGLSDATVRRLAARAREARVQPKAVCLAAVLEVLGLSLGLRDVTVGLVVNGRLADVRDALTATGLYWNLQPFTWENVMTASQAVGPIQERLARQEALALYPLSHILQRRAAGREVRFTFNYTNYTGASAEPPLGGLRTRDWTVLDNFHFPMNLRLHCDEDPSQHSLSATFDPHDPGSSAIGGLLARIADRLDRVGADERNALASG